MSASLWLILHCILCYNIDMPGIYSLRGGQINIITVIFCTKTCIKKLLLFCIIFKYFWSTFFCFFVLLMRCSVCLYIFCLLDAAERSKIRMIFEWRSRIRMFLVQRSRIRMILVNVVQNTDVFNTLLQSQIWIDYSIVNYHSI